MAGSATTSLTAVAGSPPHALLLSLTKDKLRIDWKPNFIKTANRKIVATKANNVLVLHRTGGTDIRSAINTFLNPGTKVSPQYLIDVDGFVVKLAHEADICNHAGRAFWDGATNLNDTSVGIEIVHGGNASFPNAQYDSILRLVREIRAASPTITRQRVVGHMEIAVGSADRTLSSRRIDDPSEFFEWDRLEAVSLVRRRAPGVPAETIFGISSGEFAQKGSVSPRSLTPDITAIQTALNDGGVPS